MVSCEIMLTGLQKILILNLAKFSVENCGLYLLAYIMQVMHAPEI